MSNNFTCDHFGAHSLFGECSGNGECVNEPTPWVEGSFGRCECNEGWTGRGDMVREEPTTGVKTFYISYNILSQVNADGLDCMTNIAVHKYWWGVMAIMWFFVFVYATKTLLPLVKGKSLMDVWKAQNLRVMFLSAVAGLLRTIEGISRFTTGIYVGETFLTTFLAAWAGFLFWGQLGPIFLEQVLNIIIKSMKMSGPEGEVMTKKMETMRVLMLWQIPQVMVAYLSLFATAFIEDPFIAQWLVGVYYLFSSITSIFFVFFIALPTMGAFLKIIKDANPDGTDAKLNGLEKKISIFYRETRNNGVSNTMTCIIFCIPLTQTLVTYQFAFGWTIGALITGTAIWFIAPRAKNAKRVTPSTTKSTVVEN